ncbi:MAG: DnaJ C-terminal domain-containing protein [Candidatus Thermoplasmatota archaeon]|nr:DnaJ C-terminal domain-containing protein [Candidatus Thermoplasmatota archaeon]MED5158882.1 DnaJ C-terminal domain-containing protein [Candidatus Thermoplasmatota archaeon]MEE3318558.1 DnaJ C-terminal domain-containing protein [Candidatus Thermoplasmatota archaeon]|tara:strand:- start:2625 stop:3611 length:987 start_codon:yes stop_codon:yes gene_type:complete
MAEDPYRVLGVSSDATDAEIKRAYRKLARQHHPDRNPGDAASEERFKAIQTSYEAIGTAEARGEHDQRRRMEEMFGGGGFQGNPFGGGFGGADIGDIISQFMGGRGTAAPESNFNFRQAFGGRQTQKPRDEPAEPSRGADIEAGLDISLKQASGGTEIRFSHRRLKRCDKCKGSSFGVSKHCAPCNGTGVETKGSTLTVKVPPNASHGQLLRLKKMGHEHPQGEPGDLLITLRLDADEGRRWEEGRLVQEVPIPITTLLLGGKVRISTPIGKRVQIDVPEGTRIGDRRRLQGHGHSGGPLDIEFTLAEPVKLTKAQRDALDSLRDSGL